MSSLKAVILAAGKGTRLDPLTENRPKHLLPFGGKPLLDWLLLGLAGINVTEVLLVTNYMEDKIRDHVRDGSRFGLNISYFKQEEMKGTADAFGVSEDFIGDEDFIGIYGDLYISHENIKKVYSKYKQNQTTMAVIPVDNPSQMGVVKLDGNKLTDIVEKPAPGTEPSNLANAGLFIFTPNIFKHIANTSLSSRNELEITDSLKNMIKSGEVIQAVEIEKKGWLDIGRPWNLLEINKTILQDLESKIDGTVEDGAYLHGPIIIEESARIRSGAYIEGPVYISSGCDIGPNCYIRPSSYLGKNVRIGNACEVKNSIIMEGTHIAHLSYVGDSIVGKNCNFGAGTITANIRFDKKNIKVTIKDQKMDSGQRKIGVITGDNIQTGINVNFVPGIKVGSNAWISPGLTIYKDIKSGEFVKGSRDH